MDQVYIDGLSVMSLIGVYEYERAAPQELKLDLVLDFDCKPAGVSDDLNFALDYDHLSKRVRQWASEQSFLLLEAFAESLCHLINAEFGIARVRLVINKPAAVQGCSAVGIKIVREYGNS